MSFEYRYKTSVNVLLGPFLDKSNAASAETGLTPSVAISKAGANYAARNSSRSVAHHQQGWYKVPANSVDMGTLGRIVFMAAAPNTHLAVWQEAMVLRSAAWDAKYLHPGGSALVSAAVKKALADIDLDHLVNVSAPSNVPRPTTVMAKVMVSTALSAGAFNPDLHSLKSIYHKEQAIHNDIGLKAGSTQVSSAVQRALANQSLDVISATISGRVVNVLQFYHLDHLLRVSAPAGVPQSNTVMERVMFSAAGGSFDRTLHSLRAIREKVNLTLASAQASGVVSRNLVNQSLDAISVTVSARVQNALVVNNLDHLMKTSAPAGVPASNTVLERIMVSAAAGTFDRTAHSLKAIRQRGDAGGYAGSLTSAALSGTVKHALEDIRLQRLVAASATVASHVKSNSLLNRIMVSGATSVYSQAKGNLRSIWNRAGAVVSGAVTAANISAIADEVWQRLRATSGVAPSGSFGEAINIFFGSGRKAVNHNTGGTDNLRLVDSSGNAVSDARVRIYRKTDYDSGLVSIQYVKGQTRTNDNGRWVAPVYLDSGTVYTIVFDKPAAIATTSREVTP